MNNPRFTQALKRWTEQQPQLSPKLINTLGAGLTNQSYLVESAGERFVLRLDRADAESLGVNRQRELAIWIAVANAGIAPEILYSDTESGFLVYHYIDGRTWTNEDFSDPRQRARLQQQMQLFQKIPLDLPPRNYIEYLQYYWHQLEQAQYIDAGLEAEWLAFQPQLYQLQHSNWTPVLSHHDLIPDNIIDTGERLYIVDWEYAALGHPELDWCTVTAEQNSGISQVIAWINRLWWLLAESPNVADGQQAVSNRAT